jgi:hypothetical protein
MTFPSGWETIPFPVASSLPNFSEVVGVKAGSTELDCPKASRHEIASRRLSKPVHRAERIILNHPPIPGETKNEKFSARERNNVEVRRQIAYFLVQKIELWS